MAARTRTIVGWRSTQSARRSAHAWDGANRTTTEGLIRDPPETLPRDATHSTVASVHNATEPGQYVSAATVALSHSLVEQP